MDDHNDAARREPTPTGFPCGHFPVLDGVRGIAAFMVVVVHTNSLNGSSFADRAIQRMSTLGWTGVDLFFVLSGFLITGLLADARGGRHTVRNFYIRRVLRIWPLYLAFLTVYFVIVPAIASGRMSTELLGPYEKLAYWLHFGNVHIAMRDFVPNSWLNVTWSLAVEEHFYLVWPAVAVFCSRRTAMRIAVAVMIAAAAIRFVLTGMGVSPMAVYVLTPGRMDGLAAGSWVALAARGPGGLTALRPAARLVLPGAVLALLALMTSLLVNRLTWYGVESPFTTIGYTLLAGVFAAGLILLMTASPDSMAVRVLGKPLPRTLGKYSYAIYLFHLPVCQLLWAVGWGPAMTPTVFGSQIPAQMAFTASVMVITFAFAWLSWHLYEKPFLSLKRFYPADGSQSSSLPAWTRQRPVADTRIALGA